MLTAKKSLFLSIRNVVETLSISAPTVVDALRGDLTRPRVDDRLESWASRVVRNAEVAVTVRGRDNLPAGRTFVIMSNHQSHYDVPVLFYVLGPNLRMVAKKELFQLPIFGRALTEAGFIAVDRANRRAAIESLKEAKEALARGTHIWIAPEGTRSPSGQLLPFKKGGFALALETGTPILPVTITGTREILRAKGMRSRAGAEVSVTLHPPVDVEAMARGTDPKVARDTLVTEVRNVIASALG